MYHNNIELTILKFFNETIIIFFFQILFSKAYDILSALLENLLRNDIWDFHVSNEVNITMLFVNKYFES